MLTIAQYAFHRGCSEARIRKLIRDGRLDPVVVRRAEGKKKRVFITSAADADRALDESAGGPRGKTALPQPAPLAPAPTQTKSRGAKSLMTQAEARRLKAEHDAGIAKLKREKLALENELAAGKLIAVADAERQIDSWTARVVSMVSALPARVAQAGVSAPVVAVVRREVNRMREELARDGS